MTKGKRQNSKIRRQSQTLGELRKRGRTHQRWVPFHRTTRVLGELIRSNDLTKDNSTGHSWAPLTPSAYTEAGEFQIAPWFRNKAYLK